MVGSGRMEEGIDIMSTTKHVEGRIEREKERGKRVKEREREGRVTKIDTEREIEEG